MNRPGFTTAAIVILIGLSVYQIVCIEDMRSRMDRLETKPFPLKQFVVTDAPRMGSSGPAVGTDQRHPRQTASDAAGFASAMARRTEWEEMLHGIDAWSSDGKLSSRIVELGELSQSQAQQLEALKKDFKKAREEVPVLPQKVIENSPGKVVVLINQEDAAAIKQLQIEQQQSLDAILGANFDPVLRNEILPYMNSAQLTEITLERSDNENFRLGRATREAEGSVTFDASKYTVSESRLPEVLSPAEKAALRLAGREY